MSSERLPVMSETARRHAIMAARARRLAKPRRADANIVSITCMICQSAGELYALPLSRVARVTPFLGAAQVPTRNPALLGVMGSAGIFYHVYELTRLVSSGAGGSGGHAVMLRGAPSIALRVDEAIRVAEMVLLEPDASSGMRATHPAVTSYARSLQRELFGDRTISFIDPDKLASEHAPGRVEGDQA